MNRKTIDPLLLLGSVILIAASLTWENQEVTSSLDSPVVTVRHYLVPASASLTSSGNWRNDVDLTIHPGFPNAERVG